MVVNKLFQYKQLCDKYLLYNHLPFRGQQWSRFSNFKEVGTLVPVPSMASALDIRLPQEVWEHIFSYLNTSDVIRFCKASSEHGYFLREKNIIKYFDINGDYDFCEVNLCNYIKENVSYEYIKSLNINKLYWIGLDDLRKLVKSLTNLQELLALNTELSLRPKDVLLYGKLKTLAVTVEGNHFVGYVDPLIYKNNLYLLRKLCMHISLKHPKSFIGLCKLFNELFALQELWICDTDDSVPNPIKYDALVVQLKFLTKLVIKSRVNIAFLDYKPFGLAKYFESRRFKSIVMRYERLQVDQILPFKDVSIFEPFETEIEEAWDVLRKYRSEMPYDPMAHREVYLTKQIKRVKFKELNFFHNKCFCTRDYVQATWAFLRSENSRDLRKLSVKSCVLQRQDVRKENTLASLERKYPIIDVINNCKKVNTLELMQCSRVDYVKDVDGILTCNVTILSAYSFICNWTNLERFTVEVPSHLNGRFLIDLLMTCTKLKFLRIISYNTNENLNRSVYRALPYANKLEDFCYENKMISIPVLFHSLHQISSGKLRRIYLSCDDTDAAKLTTLKDFLVRNPQLMFLYVAIHQKPRRYMQAIQQIMNAFQKKHPGKRFYAKKDMRYLTGSHPVPEVHKELFSYDSEVSTVDFYSFR